MLAKLPARIDRLMTIVDKRENMSDETKTKIVDFHNMFVDFVNDLLDDELRQQKAEGKEFLSDQEIDDLIDKIYKEEGLR